MIRFIDLRGQDTAYRFAFFNTVNDQFVTLGTDQAWRSKADLIEGSPAGSAMLERCLGLCPDWTESEVDEYRWQAHGLKADGSIGPMTDEEYAAIMNRDLP